MSDPQLRRLLRSVAANVRRLRSAKHLTQEELGEAAGLSHRFVQDVEGGRKNLSLGSVLGLARALNVEPAELLTPARLKPSRPGRPRGAASGRA